MIHNIVTDKNGEEHQAVLDNENSTCDDCSLWSGDLCQGAYQSIDGYQCIAESRQDKTSVIYKRRIKIGDVKR